LAFIISVLRRGPDCVVVRSAFSETLVNYFCGLSAIPPPEALGLSGPSPWKSPSGYQARCVDCMLVQKVLSIYQ